MAELGLGARLDTYRFTDGQLHGALSRLLGDGALHGALAAASARIQASRGLHAAAGVIERAGAQGAGAR